MIEYFPISLKKNRNDEENTSLAISKLPINSNSVVADIGAGSGYYTFRIAQKVTEGKVYAVEIQEEFIEILKQNRLQKGFKNVEIVKGTEQNPNLPANSIDLAIMVDVYHELAYPQEMLWALALIVCYRFVEAPAMAMLNPMLIDQKWSLAEIGVLMSVIGAGIGLLAAVSAAFLLKK